MTLPENFLSRMKTTLSEPGEYEAFLKSYQEPVNAGLRANTLKIAPEQLKSAMDAEFELTDINWCPEGFYYNEKLRPAKHPFYHAGLYYIQEPSAMAPASVLDVSPGHRVLDICAAPGGKSTHLGAKLKGKGILVANDISASRCKALLKNIEVAGITNAVITNEHPEKLSARFVEYFDRILVDAPCSGEGMFRKDPNAIRSWDENKPEQCVVLQRSILYHAAKMLKPGGRLLYSTCTFSRAENEVMLLEFLETNRNFKMLPIPQKALGISKGHGSGPVAENAGRLWPHRLRGEGHFLALIEKCEGSSSDVNFRESGADKSIPKRKDLAYFHEFCENYLSEKFDDSPGGFRLHGQSLFFVPEGLPSLDGIRLFRSGFYLGDLKTKRFEPSQAFAMGLKREMVGPVLNYEVTDPLLRRYLKGESFETPDASEGWNLICVEGYPLGWGKVLNGRLKNKYLKGWMMN